jgi:hypothetical protein
MIKPLITALTLITFLFSADAQDPSVRELQKAAFKELKLPEKDGWQKTGTFIANAQQGALRNWAGGGEQNTLGISTLLNYNLNYRKGHHSWNNYFDIALGFQNASSFGQFRKTDDRIDVTTKYGYQFSSKWYTGLLVNLNTQSLAGYNYTDSTDNKISGFMSPGKVITSAGIDYRPDKTFSLFISPITTRLIVKKDDDFYSMDKFGVPPEKRTYTELGSFATAKFTKGFNKWVKYTGRLDLFSNYRKDPENVDVFFTNLLSLKFNKWFATNISADIVYDDDVLKKTQLKEVLGVGLTVTL